MLGQRGEAIGIERPALADLRHHLAGAAHLAGLGVFQHQHEQVVASARRASRANDLADRSSLAGQRPAIGRQVGEAAAGQLGHLVERVRDRPRRAARMTKRHSVSPRWPGGAGPRAESAARSDSELAIMNSSGEWIAAAAHAHRVDHRHAAGGDVVAVAHAAGRLPADVLRPSAAPVFARRGRTVSAPGIDRLGRAGDAAVAVDRYFVLARQCPAAGIEIACRNSSAASVVLGRMLKRSTAWSGTTLLAAPPSIFAGLTGSSSLLHRLEPHRAARPPRRSRCARPAGCARHGRDLPVTVIE